MNNIKNIHKSPTFTILVIIFAIIGLVSSAQYSKYNHNLYKESFENYSDLQKNIYSKFHNDYRKIELDIGSLEYSQYPIDSVPVKVVLGKIKKIENPYLPKLSLAFLEGDINFVSLDDHQLLFD